MANDERRSLCEEPLLNAQGITWLASAQDTAGNRGLRIGRCGDELVAEWPGIVTLSARSDGTLPRYVVADGASPAAATRIQHEIGRALLHQAAGGLSLHASCVSWEGRAYAFVGTSGAGKSTLAAYLTESADALLIADDATTLTACAPFEVITGPRPMHALDELAQSVVAASRLAGAIDARGVDLSKTLARPRAELPPDRHTPLAAVCILAWSDDARAPRVDTLAPHDAASDLIPHLLRFVLDRPAAFAAELATIHALAKTGSIVKWVRPRDFEALQASRDLLRAVRNA